MAVDSAGYSTGSAFSAGNALATGLQQAAVYDPTQQSTTTQTSVAGKLNSQNDLTQDSSDPTQNTTSAPTAGTLSTAVSYPTWNALSAKAASPATGTAAATYVPTSATGPNSTAIGAANSTALSPYSPGNSPSTVHAPSTAAAAPTIGYNSSTSNGGNPIVSYRTADGSFAYYQFSETSGSYQYMGSYNANGQATYIQPGASELTAAQRSSATLQSLGKTFSTNDANANAGIVTQNNQAYINTWQQANKSAASDAASAANDSTVAGLLAYMQANNGQMPQQSLDPKTGLTNYTSAQLAAAQTQYTTYQNTRAAEDANAAQLGAYANKPVDTSAVDATSQAAIDSYNSIGATISGGADSGAGGRLGADNAAAIVGQGALNHQTAAAQSYYTNMQAFGNALSAQATTDANATATKLNSDVQNVQDSASALEQNLSQLDTATQQRVKGVLDQLQAQLQQYQYAMQHYKDNTQLIHNLAIGILALGGAVATVATGGLAGVAIAAGTAAAAGATAKA